MFLFRNKLKMATKEEETAFRERMREEKVGWKDGLAMVIAALITIVLPCLMILLLICGAAFLIMT